MPAGLGTCDPPSLPPRPAIDYTPASPSLAARSLTCMKRAHALACLLLVVGQAVQGLGVQGVTRYGGGTAHPRLLLPAAASWLSTERCVGPSLHCPPCS